MRERLSELDHAYNIVNDRILAKALAGAVGTKFPAPGPMHVSRYHGSTGEASSVMQALIFDCDGVLADTERFGHLPAFNQTFLDEGVPVWWSEDEYALKVRIAGGKERMASILTPEFVRANGLPEDPGGQRALLAHWHEHKTALYTELVAQGALPARPGILRLVEEAIAAGWQLAVASTSTEASVRAVLEHAVGEWNARKFEVFAGDIVPHKKPAPDIYLLALERLVVTPDDTVVIEDSANGVKAAVAAGITTVATVSSYTVDDDFTGAALVVSSIGDPGVAIEILADPHHIGPFGFVRLREVTVLLGAATVR